MMRYRALFLALILAFLSLGTLAYAQVDYDLLAPLPLSDPQGNPDESTNVMEYIPSVIRLAIALATAFAVLKIIFAGFKYISSDAFQNKSDAKGDIQEALVGILLAASAWLILYTINPELVEINLDLKSVEQGSGFATTTVVTGDDVGCAGCVSLTGPSFSSLRLKSCPAAGCYVQRELGSKLVGLDQDLEREGVDWWITEAYPPTEGVRHINSCHAPNNSRTGTCVDANITEAHTPDKIKIFLKAAIERDLNVVYEVKTAEERDRYIREIGDTNLTTGRIDDVEWITAPHFSIYN